MARELRSQDAECSIAQAAAVVGDWWSLLIVREVTRGHRRFDDLLGELGISRKVLTERLKHLVEHGVLVREPYQSGPVRYEYVLTDAGWALAPMLITMQDWADRWLLGDGTLTGAAAPRSAEAARVHALVGTRVPDPLKLPSTSTSSRPLATTDRPGTVDHLPTTTNQTGAAVHPLTAPGQTASRPLTTVGRPASVGERTPLLDVVADARATVLFGYPSTGMPAPLPPGWSQVPGAAGCTIENRIFRDRHAEFAARDIAIHGVSTQRSDEQAAFAAAEDIPFPLLSDMDLRLAAALRLPTFRAGQALRLKRLILVVDRLRVIRHVIFPVLDIPAAITEALTATEAIT
ncbi:winged helix-turn-helix transcriptional regulator [Nonomuraea sp. NEAU-A123]|uniref:winged helix-turn-helix transcriptional regulator n=1 Tax=Nonomuraea sp. NEAU-A123 TaxID=2839649 RepID=UPI001BE41CBC|nr:winged helix-turn-helix transcriptional regulator [Nonomuraea sp. NEAU-A123]MBT2230142.1 winged helix-turn-helix transcriptional regulator [Nonomuraea sp. NEAU-A123]